MGTKYVSCLRMIKIETLKTFDTQYSADSVEWNQGEQQDYFVVGTYQLEEKDSAVSANNVRKGRIYLFHLNRDTNELTNRQQIETEAILDQKWKNESTLLAATSLGNIHIYEFNEDNELRKTREISINTGGKSSLALSLDVQHGSSNVIVSDSLGRLSLLDLENEHSVTYQWKSHNFEAWTCAFDRFNKNIVYSGGDDSFFNAWDLRNGSNVLKLNSSTRDAGVTSFLNFKENILLVGSYDEKLAIYDLRKLKRPTNEINLSGGIWRIKSNGNLLLVACMYHNFSILEYSGDLKLIGEYFEHKSICYGCDWAPKTNEHFATFASCSFYDHKLSVCKVKF